MIIKVMMRACLILLLQREKSIQRAKYWVVVRNRLLMKVRDMKGIQLSFRKE
jgi:hypothetical protein